MFGLLLRSSFCCSQASAAKRTSARSRSAGLTALALFLGVDKITIAFPVHGFHTFQVCRISSESHSKRNISVDGVDLDTSRLPRLFVGNLKRTRRISPKEGLTKTFQNDESMTSILQPGIPIPLNEDQSHYLTTVLRLGKKSKAVPYVRLFDESGDEWLAKILASSSKRQKNEPLNTECVERLRKLPSDSPRQCWLIVAPTKKKDRLRWMIEKCTELDVAGFLLLQSEFSETPSLAMTKMQAYAIEAAEQSERLTVPRFVVVNVKPGEDSTSMDDLLDAWRTDSERVSLAICRERSDKAESVLNYLSSKPDHGIVAFVVGPEGGWSTRETDVFDSLIEEDSDSIQSVSLGPTVLRSETACMVSVSSFSLVQSDDYEVL